MHAEHADNADPALVRWLFETVWSRGETGDLRQRLGSHTLHYRDRTMQLEPAQLARLVDGWRAGFPDLEFRIIDLVADGDLVATRCRLTGTHRGTWRDREPTGRAVDVGVMMFFRFDGDGLAEAWELDDMAALEAQLDGA